MNASANFKVDPRLASLLGENYRSTELAIKELIDNSFDADAEHVWVTLPKPLTNDPIIIRDDGTGMTENEVRNEYLRVASSRVSRKGVYTKLKKRKVKGRKGIGKFAGLMVASLMEIQTRTRGKSTNLKIWRDELSRANYDLEQIDLPIHTELCDAAESGTEILLNGINQNFTFPNADKLKRLLILEYGRQPDFKIYVDGELVDIEDIPGDNFEFDLDLEKGDTATVRYTISDGRKALKQSGIAIRVGGKIVGSPQYFGLETCEQVPQPLLKRVYGEIMADCLEGDVTADWGSVIDNSIVLHEIVEKLRPLLLESLLEVYQREITLTKARLKRKIDLGLADLPPLRRKYAERTLEKLLRKFYGESESRIASVMSVLLETFEKNDYWMVTQHLEEARNGQVDDIVEAFSEFGMLDIAMMAQQSSQRLMVLKDLEKLIGNPEANPEQIYRALANNLWLLGSQYALVSTNAELQQVVNLYLDHRFSNGHSAFRPNLLLVQDFNKRFILIDLKSPDHTIDLSDRRKAKEYIKDLQVYLPQRTIEVIIMGGALSSNLVEQRANADIRFISYKGMMSDARVQLNWLLEELKKR